LATEKEEVTLSQAASFLLDFAQRVHFASLTLVALAAAVMLAVLTALWLAFPRSRRADP